MNITVFASLMMAMLVILLTGISIITYFISNYFNFKKELKNKELYLSKTINYKEITDMLDSFIDENLTEFIIYNPKYTSHENVPEKLVNLMPKELSYMVISRMSDYLKEQLKLIYNTEYIEEVITRRCILVCMDFVNKYNNAHNGISNKVSIL